MIIFCEPGTENVLLQMIPQLVSLQLKVMALASHVRQPAQHFPGFDGLRLLAAVTVIYSHAFVIIHGSKPQGLAINYSLAEYAVYTFFIISGFLLARSLTLNSDAVSYAVNRCLRLLPAFIFYTLVTGLLIGPLSTSGSLGAYFTDVQTYGFFRWGLDSLSSVTLPSVFSYKGEYAAVVNGSLWSLHYEALSYIFLLILWVVFRSSGLVAIMISSVAVLMVSSTIAATGFKSIAHTLPYFSAGVLMNAIHHRVGTHWLGALACLGLFVASCLVGLQALTFAICGAYLIVFFGERPNPASRIASTLGDLSYGLYLFGWPAEQMVMQWTGTKSPWLLFGLAVPLTSVFAFGSYHWIEKPAMANRRKISQRVKSLIARTLEHVGQSKNAELRGGRIAFTVGGSVILLSGSQWWFVLESLGILIILTTAGTLIAALIQRLTRPRQPTAVAEAQ